MRMSSTGGSYSWLFMVIHGYGERGECTFSAHESPDIHVRMGSMHGKRCFRYQCGFWFCAANPLQSLASVRHMPAWYSVGVTVRRVCRVSRGDRSHRIGRRTTRRPPIAVLP